MNNMILKVKNNNGNTLGTLTFSRKGLPVCDNNCDTLFKDFVLQSVEKGITRMVDRVMNDGSRTIISEPVSQNDPIFPLAFKEFLERSGYDVTEKYPNVEEAIRDFLAVFPDDNEDKKDILQRLPKMSYLEQSAILEGLKEITRER